MRRILFPVLLTVLLLVASCNTSKSSTPGATSAFSTATAQATVAGATTVVTDFPCESVEHLVYHVHVLLSIYANGQPIVVPANIGIRSNCLFWLHTHDASGLIHVEAPSPRTFTLGDFFKVYGQPLSATELLSFKTDATHQIQATIDGKAFIGDPSTIPLANLTRVVLQYGPPFATVAP